MLVFKLEERERERERDFTAFKVIMHGNQI